MAELLNTILSDPSSYSDITSQLRNVEPPAGLTSELWQLRHELPLHIINFLRERTARILSQSAASSQTPSKSRPAKYDYCSPVKSVSKTTPAPAPPHTADNTRKPKKKVKLFPAGGGSKTHKSFSDVEERLGRDACFSSSSPAASQFSEGVFELPVTPVRNNRRSGEEAESAGQLKKRGSNSSRMTPSPQAFNLGDFLVKSDTRKGRTVGPKSPSKVKGWSGIKSSTPHSLAAVSRIQSLESRLASLELEEEDNSEVSQLDLKSRDMFPSIGEKETKTTKRIKPIPIIRATTGQQAEAVFGKESCPRLSHPSL